MGCSSGSKYRYRNARVGRVCFDVATTPCELVNSVMIRPHPPWERIRRRKTVSVTPTMGASTVAGSIRVLPIWNPDGNISNHFSVLKRPVDHIRLTKKKGDEL